MIEPTVGRVVWIQRGSHFSDQPEAGLIAYVHTARLVNVAGFDRNGLPFALTSLKLLQDNDPLDYPGQPHAQWMPYQKGQAAKTEELAEKIADYAHQRIDRVEAQVAEKV